MALKVVPADDERCDIHNGRTPATYICKRCMQELGVEPASVTRVGRVPVRRLRRRLRRGPFRRARRAFGRLGLRRRGKLVVGGTALLVGAGVAVALLIAGGGGGGGKSGPPTQAEVVEALNLSPNPDGNGWITLDGACAVPSIQIGPPPGGVPPSGPTLASNESGTVRAVVSVSFSTSSQAACVERIRAALREHF